jgi:hypothetical protein
MSLEGLGHLCMCCGFFIFTNSAIEFMRQICIPIFSLSTFLLIHSIECCSQISGFIAMPSVQNESWLGLSYAPILGYRTLQTDDRDLQRAVIDTRNDMESQELGNLSSLHFQLRHSKNRNKRISSYSGLIYEGGIDLLNLKYKSEQSEFIGDLNDPLLPKSVETLSKFRYIQIPLSFGLFYTTNKWSFQCKAGLSANIKTHYSKTRTLTFSDGTSSTNEQSNSIDFRSLTSSAHLHLGVEYLPARNFSVFSEIFYSKNFIAIADTPVKEYLRATGIRFGIRLLL